MSVETHAPWLRPKSCQRDRQATIVVAFEKPCAACGSLIEPGDVAVKRTTVNVTKRINHFKSTTTVRFYHGGCQVEVVKRSVK